jgi:hypothetical protein
MMTFGSEVEGRRGSAGPVTPIYGALPVTVLVVVENPISVFAGVPVLSHRQLRHRAVDVLLRKLPACKSRG